MDNMNPIGNGLNFPHFHPLNFRDYRNYLPTAYDDSLSMQESLLQVLNFCNEIGLLNQNMSDNWNTLLGWIKTNGIDDAVSGQLNAWIADGTMAKVLDKTVLNQINQKMDDLLDEAIDFRHSDMLGKTFNTSRLRGDFFDRDLQQRGINVRWFGATGDGSTDDTQAFLDAITAANKLGFGVFVPMGRYVISQTLTISGMSFRGLHKADTYLFAKSVDTLIQLGDDAEVSDLCLVDRLNGKDIANVALGGAGLDSGGNTIERVSIKGTIEGFHSTGIIAAPTGTAEANHHVFPNTIRDVSMFDVYDAIIFDSANYGWVNSNLVENINVQGFSHSALWITSSGDHGSGISHNTFRNIQAEYLPSTPNTARAFRIECGVNNRFEMIHTWQDQGSNIQIPSMLLKPSASVKSTAIKNNVFDGVFESEIEYDTDTFGFNDLSGIKLSYWLAMHFNNQIAALNGSQDTPAENLLPLNLVSDFANGIPSPLSLEGSVKITKKGVDEYGPYVQFEPLVADQNSGVFEFALNRNQDSVKSLAKMTVGVEFDLAGGDDTPVSMSPSVYAVNNGAKSALPRTLTQVSKDANGIYRMTACVDNSKQLDGNYCISAFWANAKFMRIRRFFLVGGWVGPDVKITGSIVTRPWVFTSNTKLTLASASGDLIKQLGILSAGSGAQNYWIGKTDITEIQRADTTFEYHTPLYC